MAREKNWFGVKAIQAYVNWKPLCQILFYAPPLIVFFYDTEKIKTDWVSLKWMKQLKPNYRFLIYFSLLQTYQRKVKAQIKIWTSLVFLIMFQGLQNSLGSRHECLLTYNFCFLWKINKKMLRNAEFINN